MFRRLPQLAAGGCGLTELEGTRGLQQSFLGMQGHIRPGPRRAETHWLRSGQRSQTAAAKRKDWSPWRPWPSGRAGRSLRGRRNRFPGQSRSLAWRSDPETADPPQIDLSGLNVCPVWDPLRCLECGITRTARIPMPRPLAGPDCTSRKTPGLRQDGHGRDITVPLKLDAMPMAPHIRAPFDHRNHRETIPWIPSGDDSPAYRANQDSGGNHTT